MTSASLRRLLILPVLFLALGCGGSSDDADAAVADTSGAGDNSGSADPADLCDWFTGEEFARITEAEPVSDGLVANGTQLGRCGFHDPDSGAYVTVSAYDRDSWEAGDAGGEDLGLDGAQALLFDEGVFVLPDDQDFWLMIVAQQNAGVSGTDPAWGEEVAEAVLEDI